MPAGQKNYILPRPGRIGLRTHRFAVISFVSLFLALTTGAHPVQVAVTAPVAAVEIRLDGQTVGRLDRSPWALTCDFGARLQPHELVAIGFGSDGGELERIRQWINLPRPAAEADLMLEEGEPNGRLAARLIWRSLQYSAPAAVRFFLDGAPIAAASWDRLLLPACDLDKVHVLSAEVHFSDRVSLRVERGFGGEYGTQAATELTAVPLLLGRGPRDQELPPLGELQGWLAAGGEPLRVLGAERGPAKIILVIDAHARELVKRWRLQRVLPRWPGGSTAPLGEADRLHLLWPVARTVAQAEAATDLFPLSPPLGSRDGELPWLIASSTIPPGDYGPQRLADAVAGAGVHAVAGNYRRAVVLALGGKYEDRSERASVEMARAFLSDLHVPLVVWRLGIDSAKAGATPWGEARPIASLTDLGAAAAELQNALDRQRILWVEGRHLPQTIQLAPGATSRGPRGLLD